MKKSLVAYFSHSGQNYFVGGYKNITKGNAKIIAEKINELIDSDIFEIDTKREYSKYYEECCKEAKLEQRNNELPELKEYLSRIDEYENIFLVYPCWWGTMPQGVFTFLNHYDFSGKTIYPVCTHEGSGMGRSEADIVKVCRGAKVKVGLAIQGTYAETCDDKLKSWLK